MTNLHDTFKNSMVIGQDYRARDVRVMTQMPGYDRLTHRDWPGYEIELDLIAWGYLEYLGKWGVGNARHIRRVK
jgi:hypothetical protein